MSCFVCGKKWCWYCGQKKRRNHYGVKKSSCYRRQNPVSLPFGTWVELTKNHTTANTAINFKDGNPSGINLEKGTKGRVINLKSQYNKSTKVRNLVMQIVLAEESTDRLFAGCTVVVPVDVLQRVDVYAAQRVAARCPLRVDDRNLAVRTAAPVVRSNTMRRQISLPRTFSLSKPTGPTSPKKGSTSPKGTKGLVHEGTGGTIINTYKPIENNDYGIPPESYGTLVNVRWDNGITSNVYLNYLDLINDANASSESFSDLELDDQ